MGKNYLWLGQSFTVLGKGLYHINFIKIHGGASRYKIHYSAHDDEFFSLN